MPKIDNLKRRIVAGLNASGRAYILEAKLLAADLPPSAECLHLITRLACVDEEDEYTDATRLLCMAVSKMHRLHVYKSRARWAYNSDRDDICPVLFDSDWL